MARPKAPTRIPVQASLVSGNPARAPQALAGSAAVYSNKRLTQARRVNTDRREIAKRWQVEAYRHVNICGEARYAASLFASTAGRAEIGISQPQALVRKPVWVNSGPEVDVLAEIAPTVRERSKLIRNYMLHRVIAGECYLIARDRLDTDPEYATRAADPVWEIVAVTELRKTGAGEYTEWQVRHQNGEWISLSADDPVIRMWNPDPENREEAWSPFRSLLPTLREIEWLTKHIFTQVRSRLMSAGIWFLPENLTFAPPPPEAVEGGEEAIANMNEAEQFMLSLAHSAMQMLDADEVAMPSIVMADPIALPNVDQNKLIKFWSEIDDKAMLLRSDSVRRFALGMDMPPEQILGSSGIAVTGAGGSAGSVNHWGVWANEEQTISDHIEPALDDLVSVLTSAVLRNAVPGTKYVVAYDTANLRLRQDRSKESMELYDRGLLKADVALRENGFDPASDQMDDKERKFWLLNKVLGGTFTPEQMQGALALYGVDLPIVRAYVESERVGTPKELPGRSNAPSLEDHPYEGPPRVQNDHSPAPFGVLHASCEVLVLRALEKAGNRLLNDGRRGKDKDRSTPAHMAHLVASVEVVPEFDFGLLPTVMEGESAVRQAQIGGALHRYCARMYREGVGYSREGLMEAVKGL
jgi:hypothetical protein